MDRYKLIELINQMQGCGRKAISETETIVVQNEALADHLIANGIGDITALKAENERLNEQLKNSVQLPCKVGDMVYTIHRYYSEENIHRIVKEQIKVINGTQFCIKEQPFIWGICCRKLEWVDIPMIGFYIFTTKEAAEARLKELEVER